MEKKEDFLARIRPHAEWEVIRWLWGIAAVFLFPLTYGLIQHARRLQVDWIGLGILFVLSLILICLFVYVFRKSRLGSNVPSPSKLIIHSARYETPAGTGYDVSEFLRQIITGDGLVFKIQNHSFVIGGHNFVPTDPAPGKTKYLRINYSYDDGLVLSVERPERSLLVLPEDSFLKEQANKRSDQAVDKAAVAAQNRLLEIGRSVDGLFTPLQIDAFRLASEIRKFSDQLGPRPVTHVVAYTEVERAETRALQERQKAKESRWVEQLTSGYVLRFAPKVKTLRFRLGEAGVPAPYKLDRFMESIIGENDLQECAQTLEQMALELHHEGSPQG